MKMFSKIKQGGFTLIEIILTLVIAAIVGTGLVQYLGSAFTKSSVPIQRLKQAHDLQEVMENINADYRANVKNKVDLKSLRQRIKTTPGIYGTSYDVVSPTPKFVTFATQMEFVPESDPDMKKIFLMVTIKKDSGEILTTIFSAR